MKRDSLSVLIACACGAGIGSMLALQLGWLWPLGALMGGVIAWIIVDFRALCTGVAQVYQRTIAWKPDMLYWRAVRWLVIAHFSIALSGVSIISILEWVLQPVPSMVVVMYVTSFFAIMHVLVTFALAIHLASYSAFCLQSEIERQRIVARCANPVGLIYYAFYYLYRGLVNVPRAVTATGRGLKVLGTFLWTAFVYVHSARRTLCFTDAAIGATVGYLCGNALWGALVGGVLGFLNYELVAVRWLKVAPR